VSLRLVCDREEEIENFQKEEYWIIDVELQLSKVKIYCNPRTEGNDKIKVSSERS